ncbi:hypothetical protein ACSBR1_018485 [Camellia fascicularis]
MSLFPSIFLGLLLGYSSITSSESIANEFEQKNLAPDPRCPMNFTVLQMTMKSPYTTQFSDVPTECFNIREGFRVVRSEYLRTTGNFSPPPNTSEACFNSIQLLVTEALGRFDLRSNCWSQISWITNICSNITTRSDFEALISQPELQKVNSSCNQPLGDSSSCDSCTASLSSIEDAYSFGSTNGNLSDCSGYPHMYAAAFANDFGPTDPATAKCLFKILLNPTTSPIPGNRKHKIMLLGVGFGCVAGFFGSVFSVWLLWRLLNHSRKKIQNFAEVARCSGLGFGLLDGSTTLVKFAIEDMKEATKNFDRRNLIGRGGYGNVYRGVLANGSEVALKRFKNCSALGDENFTHEVQVIASVKHVNLVALRGYCIATDPLGPHQRIIVCDFMHNGSVYDHLFGSGATKLSWPIRRKIALGIARGLAYLHNGAQPAIIHRDVKASNILLDEAFEPKLADFGLAKFTPDGLSHLSTRMAGTLGYVAPEYALYGQLTERSDVYSFGVVLLELLSGKQAVVSVENGQPLLLTDWAWSQVRKGNPLDVIEEGMLDMALPEVMEKYVLLAIVSAHPLLHARPNMEQIVMIMETRDLGVVPSIPDYPISVLEGTDDIKESDTPNVSDFISTDQQSSESSHSKLDHKEEDDTSLEHAV